MDGGTSGLDWRFTWPGIHHIHRGSGPGNLLARLEAALVYAESHSYKVHSNAKINLALRITPGAPAVT
jgi:hypothetical protein